MIRTTIYDTPYHSPCEHYALQGLRHLSLIRTDYDDCGEPTESWDWPRIVEALLDGAPKKIGKRVRWPKTPDSKPATIAGERIDWYIRFPRHLLWSGQMTIHSIIGARRDALANWQGEPLDQWLYPLSGASGIDCRSVISPLDAGFSPNQLGMDVAMYAGLELLAMIGMQVSPTTWFGWREYGYQDDHGRWWSYDIEQRPDGKYMRMLGMARRREE